MKNKATTALMVVIFAPIFITLVLLIPNPTEFEAFIFRCAFALIAAVVAYAIGGVVSPEEEFFAVLVRAGAAIAIFALVYLMDPLALLRPRYVP